MSTIPELLTKSITGISDDRVSYEINTAIHEMNGKCPFRWLASILRSCGMKINGKTKEEALPLERQIRIQEIFKNKRPQLAELYLAEQRLGHLKGTLSSIMYSKALDTDEFIVDSALKIFKRSIDPQIL